MINHVAHWEGDGKMGDIAVIHKNMMAKGGGEAVAMNVLEALQAEHDVTLLTLTTPDFDTLNDFFNTDVRDIAVRRAGVVGPTINAHCGTFCYLLQMAILGRYVKRHADEFDLFVSTINELSFGSESIQYIHFPFDWTLNLDNRDQIFHPSEVVETLYERLCRRVAEVDRRDIRSNVLLTNSEWTATVVEDTYETSPRVLYPPIDTSEFDPYPWDKRQDGFVTVGRIERSKRIAELIRVIDGVRDRGHDVHFHIIGPIVDEGYHSAIEAMAAERNYVYIDGEVSRSALVNRICTHKYGIHGKEFEHFGMAVAELAAGGTVPFVPDSGGQNAIVDDNEEQLFESLEDAVDKISTIVSDEERQRTYRMTKTEIKRRFGRERFRQQFREVVEEALNRQNNGSLAGIVDRECHPRYISNDRNRR